VRRQKRLYGNQKFDDNHAGVINVRDAVFFQISGLRRRKFLLRAASEVKRFRLEMKFCKMALPVIVTALSSRLMCRLYNCKAQARSCSSSSVQSDGKCQLLSPLFATELPAMLIVPRYLFLLTERFRLSV
jgi:hypothetical protein